jgi:hypothetical protein
MTYTEVLALFEIQEKVYCPLWKVDIVKEDGSDILINDPEYDRFQIALRDDEAIKVNTVMSTPEVALRRFYKMGIKGITQGLLSATQTLIVDVGCFEQVTTMTHNYTRPLDIIAFKEPEAGFTEEIFIRLLSFTPKPDENYDLSTIIKFSTNIVDCEANSIVICYDATC